MEVHVNQGTLSLTSEDGRVFIYAISAYMSDEDEYVMRRLLTDEDMSSLDERIALDEHNISANITNIDTNRNNISTINADLQSTKATIGDVQMYDMRSLPSPNSSWLNKVVRVGGELYECITDGVEKVYSFENVTGTSEVTSLNWDSFANEVSGSFKNDFTLSDIYKVFRNVESLGPSSIRLGNSSKTGYLGLDILYDEYPISKITVKVKPYNTTKNSGLYFSCADTENETLIEPGNDPVDVVVYNPSNPNYLNNIYLESFRPDTNGDYRIKILSIDIVYGSAECQWRKLTKSTHVVKFTLTTALPPRYYRATCDTPISTIHSWVDNGDTVLGTIEGYSTLLNITARGDSHNPSGDIRFNKISNTDDELLEMELIIGYWNSDREDMWECYRDEMSISNIEYISRKTTTLSASSTDAQYPSAKCVYDKINSTVGDIETLLANI